jgi:drug/metabolite transporter (DMT)-like permease
MNRESMNMGAPTVGLEDVRASASKEPGAWATHVALGLVQIGFAAGTVEGKIAMRPWADGGGGIPPFALGMLRMLGGAIFFLGVTQALNLRKKTTLRDHIALALLAVVGIVLNQTLFLAGLRLTTPVSAALLSTTIPVFTAAIAIAARVERPSVRSLGGLALALLGVLWLTGVRAVDHGAVLVAMNSLSYALYLVFGRNVIRRLGAFTVVTWVYVWATLLFAPIGGHALLKAAPELTARGWEYAAFIVVVPTIFAHILNAWALGRSSTTLVTVYIYVQPLMAAVLAWVQLGQGLSARLVVAAILIFAGVSVVASRRPAALPRASSA